MPGQTLIEKIATRHALGLAEGEKAYSGDFLTIQPRHIMTHDNTSAVMKKFTGLGAEKIYNPRQPVFAIDHDIQNTTPENLGKYARIEQFARKQGVDFYAAGTGISHQVMVEYGYVTPGSMVVGSDSHSNLYGALSALGTPVVRTDAASIWATGKTWWQVPPVARVELTGKLQPGVVGKDVIITLCGYFNHDEVLNMAVEFVGDGLSCLSMDQRMSIANMTTEWGALAGVFPFDEVLRDYLYKRADFLTRVSGEDARYTRADVDRWYSEPETSDPDAVYALELTLDLSTVIPHVSGPDHVKVMHSLPEIEKQKIKIDKAYLLSCVNARQEDLHAAAEILRGRKIASHVKMYVAAASANVQKEAEESGDWDTLLSAGAVPLPPGCGTCIGLGAGTLEAGEVGISATNRNFKGRMGSRDAKAYLASPAVVAASAAAGYICAPEKYPDIDLRGNIKVNETKSPAPRKVEVIEGFPDVMKGRVLWLPVDNLNTDGIYSGKMTYRDDVTPEEMAAAAMENYDPHFQEIAREGDIIVSGKNFGTGSSREQAATCLALRGIQC
ncbi:MAG TPA: homoaconitase, partial [Phycisphaeraceae bacterium]|nr:homoaconitase [Phycisphaeraceae bacterium]